MKTSNEIDKIIAAIEGIQDELKPMHKDTRAFKYKYVTWESIIKYIRPLLKKNGLVCIQSPSTPPIELWPALSLTTKFYHLTSKQWIEDTLTMPMPDDIHEPHHEGESMITYSRNPFQAAGSGITYAKRYMFSAMLGIVDSKDMDGTFSEKPKIPTMQELTTQYGADAVLEAHNASNGDLQAMNEYLNREE